MYLGKHHLNWICLYCRSCPLHAIKNRQIKLTYLRQQQPMEDHWLVSNTSLFYIKHSINLLNANRVFGFPCWINLSIILYSKRIAYIIIMWLDSSEYNFFFFILYYTLYLIYLVEFRDCRVQAYAEFILGWHQNQHNLFRVLLYSYRASHRTVSWLYRPWALHPVCNHRMLSLLCTCVYAPCHSNTFAIYAPVSTSSDL